jgi:hypothetical protein
VAVYKRSPILQAGGTRSLSPSPCELLELSAHPIVTSVHLQYQTTECRAITSKEGPEPGYIIMCFVVHKTNSKLEHVILTTLFLLVQKTPIGGEQRDLHLGSTRNKRGSLEING